jgi:surface polysaccharide O-acyltransferase-like enzyme
VGTAYLVRAVLAATLAGVMTNSALVSGREAPPMPRSAALDVLRIVAIFGVVAIHVFGGIVVNPELRTSPTWWAGTVVQLASIWVVPGFVMVSGALLLGARAHQDGPGHFYRKRLLRLGPAFIAWQLFYVFVVRIWMSGQQLSLGGIFQLFADGKTYTHLYFLWLIVGLYAIAPILASFLNQGGQRRAFIFAGSVLLLTFLVYGIAGLSALHGSPRPIVLGALTQWVPYVGYFLAGWALRSRILNTKQAVIVALVTVLAFGEIIVQHVISPHAALLQALAPVGYLGPVVALATIGVFLVVQSVFARIRLSHRSSQAITLMSAATFGTFLIHFFFLILAEQLIPGLVGAISSSFWAAALVWACIVALSFAVSMTALKIPYLRHFF